MVKRSALVIALLLLPGAAFAREEIRVVGSSTVFPLVAAAAEQFGRATGHRTPVVESTGTGGGFKIFCEGAGEATPDISNASRAIKPGEIELCKKNGVTGITELPLGFDGIVFANALQSPSYKLTRHDLFLAMAREVPKHGTLVPNFYTRWREINAALPDAPIEIYGPPPVEGTRDALVELVMAEGCKQSPEYAANYPDEKLRKTHCESMREDGRFTELLGGNLMVQKLVNNHNALAIFGYSYLEQNTGLVKANPVENVLPTPEYISNGSYPVARTLYAYVKNQHADSVPGLREFVGELTSDAAVGEDGYLALKGLLPLPPAQHEAVKRKVSVMTDVNKESPMLTNEQVQDIASEEAQKNNLFSMPYIEKISYLKDSQRWVVHVLSEQPKPNTLGAMYMDVIISDTDKKVVSAKTGGGS